MVGADRCPRVLDAYCLCLHAFTFNIIGDPVRSALACGESLNFSLSSTAPHGFRIHGAGVPQDRLRYDACLALGVTTAPQPLRVLALPAGDYARLRHLGSYDGLEATTQHLVGDWLPASGWEPANFPVFHHFISDPDATPVEELVTDILLPLASSQESSRD